MAVITEIPWEDGSGDKIYLTRDASEGSQIVAVTSDANTGEARSKTVEFTSSIGGIVRQLTISQEAGGPQEHTITLYPSSYDTEHYSWYSQSNISNGYDPASSSNYAQFYNAGRYAECYIYYKFDTSQIPDGATITSVECSVKTATNGNSTTTPQKKLQMATGTTLKGEPHNMTTAVNTFSIDCGDWTLEELRDIRIRAYTKAGSTTSRYFIRFYGATLTITYTL